jgi:ABC-type transporter Mla subunit MlaD
VEPIGKPNYEYRVGFFTLVAIIILLWGWSWLKSFTLHPPQRFTVKFHDVAGLSTNAPVNVNGVRVGTVEKIELRGKGQVLCRLKITTEDSTIPEGSKITIQTLGLVGAKYVEISLPEVKPDEPVPPPIAPDTVITGEDPVRTELYMNKIASNLSRVSDALGSESARDSLAKAAQTSGATMVSFKEAAEKFNKNMDKLSEATASFNNTANRFSQGANSATGFFNEGTQTMERVSTLAQDLQKTSHKVDKILDNPALSGDLKETARLARDTAEKVQTAIHEINATLTDKPFREDLLTIMNKLSGSTENIYESMKIVRTVSNDQGLRSDVKEAVANAKEAITKANALLGQENFASDAKLTMSKLRTAADEVDLASKNINQLLGHKRPLLHMMFGGGEKPEKKGKTNNVKAAAVPDKSAPSDATEQTDSPAPASEIEIKVK